MQERCCTASPSPSASKPAGSAAGIASVYERPLIWSPFIPFQSTANDLRLLASDAVRFGLRIFNGSTVANLYVNFDGSAANGVGLPIAPGTGLSFTGADCSPGEIHVALAAGAAASQSLYQVGRRG